MLIDSEVMGHGNCDVVHTCDDQSMYDTTSGSEASQAGEEDMRDNNGE